MWTTIIATLLLDATATAGERWEDGLTDRAPTTAYGAAAGTYAPGPDRLLFGDLHTGAPLHRAKETLTIGLGAHVAAASGQTADDRSFGGVRNIGADLWVTSSGGRELTAHSMVFGLHTPIADSASTSWYEVTPNEVALRVGLAYDGYLDFEGLDLSMEGRAGLAGATVLDVTWTLVALAEITDDLVIGGGATVGLLPFGTAIATARFRPTASVEIGVGASAPFRLFDAPPPSGLQPMAEIKIFR